VQGLAQLIFTRYVFPFEATAALLITAALGAMVLAHRERTAPKPTQRDLARQRVAGAHPAPLPGPGVYARHNAVDFPALLPDGTPSQLSVNPVIARAGRGRLGHEPSPGPELPPGNGTAAESHGQALEGTGPEGAGAEHEEARP
jgi:NADH-quinone oxidoreductase subunit J